MMHPYRAAVLSSLLILSGLLLGGCELPRMPWDAPPPAATEEAHDSETGHHGEEESEYHAEESEETPAADLSLLVPAAMRDLPYSEVNVTLPDKLVIYGRLYNPALSKDEDGETITPADLETEYGGPRYPLVILLHGLNKTNRDWQALPATLVKAGYAVFAMDLRGHGLSTRQGRNRTSWRLMKDEQWPQLHKDVDQVLKYFQKSEDHPEVDTGKVAVVGEKLGANVATHVASLDKGQVKALVLLSPSISFKGIDASKGLMGYPNSTLIVINRAEPEAATAARHLYNWVLGPKTFQEYDFKRLGQGTDLLTGTAVGDQIRDWLMEHLPPAGSGASAQNSSG